MTVVRNILVPLSLLRKPTSFGGERRADCLQGDLVVNDGQVVRLDPATRGTKLRMLVPALTEAHCHLDKCHTISRLEGAGGDLKDAIFAQMQDKRHWTEQDIRSRMLRGLNELAGSGCRHVRSHVDWGDTTTPPVAWHILAELASDSKIHVQSAALTGIDQMADWPFCDDIAQHLARVTGSVLGAFILNHDETTSGLRHIFAVADRYGLPLDFHVDEGLGSLNGLESVCDIAIETGFAGPVLCGHAVSLIERSKEDMARITDKLLRAGISICALPTTNLYLQGRRDGTPDRRGLTRLRELHEAGVPIVVASDNVADAFCPMGQHDPRAALHLASLAAHLDPPVGRWLPSITTDAATSLGIDTTYIEDCPINDLRLCDATSTADFVAGRAPLTPLYDALETSET